MCHHLRENRLLCMLSTFSSPNVVLLNIIRVVVRYILFRILSFNPGLFNRVLELLRRNWLCQKSASWYWVGLSISFVC